MLALMVWLAVAAAIHAVLIGLLFNFLGWDEYLRSKGIPEVAAYAVMGCIAAAPANLKLLVAMVLMGYHLYEKRESVFSMMPARQEAHA